MSFSQFITVLYETPLWIRYLAKLYFFQRPYKEMCWSLSADSVCAIVIVKFPPVYIYIYTIRLWHLCIWQCLWHACGACNLNTTLYFFYLFLFFRHQNVNRIWHFPSDLIIVLFSLRLIAARHVKLIQDHCKGNTCIILSYFEEVLKFGKIT